MIPQSNSNIDEISSYTTSCMGGAGVLKTKYQCVPYILLRSRFTALTRKERVGMPRDDKKRRTSSSPHSILFSPSFSLYLA